MKGVRIIICQSRWYLALFREHDRLKRGMLVAKMNEDEQSQYQRHMDTVGLEPDD